MDILSKVCPSILESTCTEDRTQGEYSVNDGKGDSHLEGVWQMLYSDCLSALEICVEGDLKHFHKARYMLAQGLYRRGGNMDIQKAKDELSFCFKSSRSSFTINMWEIDSTVKKGRYAFPFLFLFFFLSWHFGTSRNHYDNIFWFLIDRLFSVYLGKACLIVESESQHPQRRCQLLTYDVKRLSSRWHRLLERSTLSFQNIHPCIYKIRYFLSTKEFKMEER